MKNNKYPQIIENLYSQAKNDGWKMFYEEDSDSLFWTGSPIPAGDRLAKASKEVSFYLNGNGGVSGLIIQPFHNNFLLHNEEAAEVAKLFTDQENDSIFTVPPEKSEEKDLLCVALSAIIKKDIYQDAAEANYSIESLSEFLFSSAR